MKTKSQDKTAKTVYLDKAQLEKVKSLQTAFEKETKIKFSFSSTIAKLIEERK